MDTQLLANEIGKYLLSPTRPNLSKLIKPALEVDDDGFIPVALKEFTIDPKSIKKSPVIDNIVEFSAKGEMSFSDKASKIKSDADVEFHGFAQSAKTNERVYIDAVTIDRLHRTSKIIP